MAECVISIVDQHLRSRYVLTMKEKMSSVCYEVLCTFSTLLLRELYILRVCTLAHLYTESGSSQCWTWMTEREDVEGDRKRNGGCKGRGEEVAGSQSWRYITKKGLAKCWSASCLGGNSILCVLVILLIQSQGIWFPGGISSWKSSIQTESFCLRWVTVGASLNSVSHFLHNCDLFTICLIRQIYYIPNMSYIWFIYIK